MATNTPIVFGAYKWERGVTYPVRSVYSKLPVALAKAQKLSDGVGVRAYVVRWNLDVEDSREEIVEYVNGNLRWQANPDPLPEPAHSVK